jgi:uncharacterized repeat protein (TIGR02543 family)
MNMKKIMFCILAIFSIILSSCTDQKYFDDSVNIVFFTANSNATLTDSYLNLQPGELIEEPENPERLGYAFNGWFKDIRLTDEWDFEIDVVPESSIILYAAWIPIEFSISYDLNGGLITSEEYVINFKTGDSGVLPLAKRTGYTFVGWYLYDWIDESSTKPGDTGYQVIPSNFAEDLVLYAHWEPVSVRVTFRTNYPIENEGVPNPNTRLIDYGTIINFESLADTDDYVFLGWNTRQDGEGTFYNNGEIFTRTQRITLYGVWRAKD